MFNLNRIIITGRLTRAPEFKSLPSGMSLCTFSIACNESRRKGDSWETETSFFDVKAFDKTADRCSEMMKGDCVCVEGRLKQESWEKDGKKMSKILINADTVKRDRTKGDSGQQEQSEPRHSDALEFDTLENDDVPF